MEDQPPESEALERLADPQERQPAADEPAPVEPHRRQPPKLPSELEALRHLELAAVAELGRTTLTVEDLSDLRVGGVIALDNAAGQAVDLYVNGSLVARGEVVAVDEKYGLRITEIVGFRGPTSSGGRS